METRTWWRRWVVLVTAGEVLGFLAPALVVAVTRDLPDAAVLGCLVVAGSVEGAVLGWSQAVALRPRLPRLRRGRWVVLTSAAAALAWLAGMLPSTTYAWWSGWPVAAVVALAVPLGLVLLCSIGVAQTVELRRHVRTGARWVAVTAGAWAVALTVFMAVATPLWQPGQSTAVVLLVGILAGLAMAVSMAALTGAGMAWLLRGQTSEVARSTEPSLGGSTKR